VSSHPDVRCPVHVDQTLHEDSEGVIGTVKGLQSKTKCSVSNLNQENQSLVNEHDPPPHTHIII